MGRKRDGVFSLDWRKKTELRGRAKEPEVEDPIFRVE